jgi:predicted ATP-dependent serine protease
MEYESDSCVWVFGSPITHQSVAATPPRLTVSLGETVDDLLSDGLAAGEILLITGPPGIGKSRLAMGFLRDFCRGTGRPAIYVTTQGELRAAEVMRLAACVDAVDCGVHVAELDGIEAVCSRLAALDPARGPIPVVIDSALGLFKPWDQEDGLRRLRVAADRGGVALIVLVGNQPSGAAAGPRSPLHVADAVISLHLDDDPDARLLSLCKNRFGPAPRYTSVQHTSKGLVPVEESATDTEIEDGERMPSAAEIKGHSIAILEDSALSVAVFTD